MLIEERIRAVMAEELDINPTSIVPEMGYNSIPEWDSVAHVHLITALEEAFDLVFEDGDIAEMTTFGKITDLTRQRLG